MFDKFEVEGQGSFGREGKTLFRGNAKFIWESLSERKLYFEATTSGFSSSIAPAVNTDELMDFEGTTHDKAVFKAMRLSKVYYSFSWSNGVANHTFRYHVQELEIGNTQEEVDKIEFYLLNAFLRFMNHSKNDSPSVLNRPIPLELEYLNKIYSVVIEDITDPEMVKSALDHSTLRLTVQSKDSELNKLDVETLVKYILEIMSVAYGDQLAWSFMIAYRKEVEEFRKYKSGYICSQRIHRTLVSMRFPENLENLIESCFTTYSQMTDKNRRDLKILSQGIQMSSERLFFPLPFIILASAIESFASLTLPDSSNSLLSKAKRRSLNDSFKEWIRENLVSCLDNDEDKQWLIENSNQKLAFMVQKSLRERIIALFEKFDIEHRIDEIGEFVKCRNEGAHQDYSYTSGDYEKWCKVAALLERLILKELNYKGQFNDWYEIQPVEKEFSQVLKKGL